MSSSHSTPIPTALTQAPLRTIRPRDAANVYPHPRSQLVRLAEHGLLHRLTDGYYNVVPQEMLGRSWIPNLEAAAAGIATAIFGSGNVVVMGVSAARLHGAIARALAMAIVAVPRQHRPIALSDRPAVVQFVKRRTGELDAERLGTELGPVLVTTPEQTILDLAHRPTWAATNPTYLMPSPLSIPTVTGNDCISSPPSSVGSPRLTPAPRSRFRLIMNH